MIQKFTEYTHGEESFTMSPEDMYGDEWKQIIESERKAEKEEMKLKAYYKQLLKPLLNTYIVWRWLSENDHWTPEGIFSVQIKDRHNGYYSRTMPHARIENENFNHLDMHWQKENTSEVGVNHYFIQQLTHGEDSYSGYIAFPLKDHRYFLISYAC